MAVAEKLHPQGARQNKTQVETGKSANHRRHQVRERTQQFVPLQHGVQLHDQGRQRRKTSAETYRKQQAILIRHNSRVVKPGCGCNELRNYAYCETAQQVRAQGSPWKRDIPLQEHVQAEPGHRAQSSADGHEKIRKSDDPQYLSQSQALTRFVVFGFNSQHEIIGRRDIVDVTYSLSGTPDIAPDFRIFLAAL